MMNEADWTALYEYVQSAKKLGVPYDEIKKNLLAQGWQDADLDYYLAQAYSAGEAGEPPTAPVEPGVPQEPASFEEPRPAAPPSMPPATLPATPPATPPAMQPAAPPAATPPAYAPPSAYPAPGEYPAQAPGWGEENTSGMQGTVPPEVEQMGWSWGGFGLNWIWSIGNKVWIGLLALIPCVNIGIAIYLGIAGHKLAWQNRRFDSVQQFRDTMRAWNAWGIGIFIFNVVSNVVWFIISMAMENQ